MLILYSYQRYVLDLKKKKKKRVIDQINVQQDRGRSVSVSYLRFPFLRDLIKHLYLEGI